MAATRKLQGEIDRCLKKVAEGVETFEDIWKKVHNATNSNQKEKYEADLKKEIKKLQRLRDQIKSWIASAEIKDKSSLLENRRLIETQMERFKVVERETKTKAYSKEGFGAAQKLDPAQRIKDVARNWLTNSISSLQIQIDQYECEIESILAGKKKRLDRDKQDRIDDLRSKLERHKFHVTKLETLLRLLDNDGVEADQVNKIKDDVEYYIESSSDPDFEENEFIYDDIIGLDEVELSGTDSNNSNETSGSPSSITSGGSPAPTSPQVTQQQHQQLTQQLLNASSLNYSSDSTTTDATPSEKRAKNNDSVTNNTSSLNNSSTSSKQPVKPTAVRASSKVVGSTITAIEAPPSTVKIVSSTPSKNHPQQPQQLLQQQQPHQPTAASVVAAAFSQIIQAPTPNNTNAISGQTIAAAVAAAAAASSNPAIQQHTPAPSLNSSAVSANSASSAGTPNTSIQGQSVIQTTPTIAFAAVAKNNTSHLENGPVHPANSFAMAPTVASIVGSNTQQQQQQQISNLQTNSSHLQNAHNNASNNAANSIANAVQQGAANAAAAAAVANNVGNTNSNSNNLANCISPNGMTALSQVIGTPQQVIGLTNNNARSSPALMSPKLMNGLTLTPSNAVDAISLKTMAQEAINRSIIDANSLVQTPNVDVRQQQSQQQQQQQQQQVLQQHFSTESTANQQQQQQQQQNNASSAAVAAAVVAAAAAASNGPTVGSGAMNNSINSLTNSTGQPMMSNSAAVNNKLQTQPTNEAHIPPLLGVAPLGPSPLSKDNQLQFQMMEAAFYHLPAPIDSERLTTYFHRTPVQTPPHYPQSQLPIYDTVEFYQRLSTETLFFVFYYMEGSKAQYLAAKALKKQSWRFHTKYMMWFQRHEEPKVINDDFEQGTYIYFDYEKWSQRKKEGFTFEYKYLEDKELN